MSETNRLGNTSGKLGSSKHGFDLILFKSFAVGIVVWCFATLISREWRNRGNMCQLKKICFSEVFLSLADLKFINSRNLFSVILSSNHSQITINLYVFSKTNRNQDKRPTLWMVVCLNNVVTWVMHLTPEQWLVVLSTCFCTRFHWKVYLKHRVSKSLGSRE